MTTVQEIQEACRRLERVVAMTPCALAPKLSYKLGVEVYLKKENLQNTGSFKLRGAFNKIALLHEAVRQRGVVAASAGNHAQGVAFSAKYFGVPATIVMPENTPLTKVDGVRSYGADVILRGENYDEAYAYALTYAESGGFTFVHPFADREIIAGQGSIAIEMLRQTASLDAVLIPVGGGGLISGMATALKTLSPATRVIGVAASGAPAMARSFEAKSAIDTTEVRTIADGIAVRDTSPMTLEYLLRYVDEMVLVDDEEIARAILFLLEGQKLVVEGAGAVGIAALLAGKIDTSAMNRIGVVISGGNIDVTMLSVIIEKGLIKSYRKMKLIVTLVDKPGSLMELTDIFKANGANIVHIGYDRTSVDLRFGDAYVSIGLETKGQRHQEQIKASLEQRGYRFEEDDRTL